MNHRTQSLILMLIVALAISVSACTAPEKADEVDRPSETPSTPEAGLRLAPGLYDIEGGKVQALGVLEYRDVEGGFYAIVDTTQDGKIVAVVANEDYFRRQLEPLNGKSVNAIGTRADGASVRMAGPEIVLESIEEVKDTPDNISE